MGRQTQATVLLLGAKSTVNPLASIPEELSQINQLFDDHKSAQHRYQLKYEPYLTRKLLTKLLKKLTNQVAILHFAGHSDEESLQTDDELVYSQHIANILKTWTIPPSLIFLNGCQNAEQVQLFLDAGVALIIATHHPIDDQQASQFAREFYQSLFAENGETSIQHAFDRAGETVFMGQKTQPRSFDLESIDQLETEEWDWSLFPKHEGILEHWTIRQLLETNRPVLDKQGNLLNPYKGLESFKEEDKAWFFGREALTTELSQQILKERFFSLLGASGSGKSSLINAGVVPQLREHDDTLILQTRPSQKPFNELANTIAQSLYPDSTATRLSEQKLFAESLQTQQLLLSDLIDDLLRQCHKTRLLLCIDQFEELFTHSEIPIIQAYLDRLIQLIDSNSHCTVLLIMRADFLGAALGYPQFAERLDQYPDKKLGSMSKAELRAAIEKPANKQHIQLEASLIEALLDDVENQAGSLPLLQYVLSLLWEKRKNSTIKLDDYNAFGGLKKALETKADEIYQSFTETQQTHCKQIFLRLINPSEVTEVTKDTRRRANLSEFSEHAESKAIIKTLADARLITTQQSSETEQAYAEVSHEALIRHWGKLKEWMEENRDQIRTRLHITARAQEWHEQNKDTDGLLRGTRLRVAEDWLKKNTKDASKLEIEFIKVGINERDRKIKEKEKQRKRVRNGVIAFVAMLSVVLLFALTQWKSAVSSKEKAIASELVAKEETEKTKQKILDANYNLAKAYEQKIKLAIADGDKDKSLSLIEYRKAWLYALEAESRKIPEGKQALKQSSFNQVTSFSVKTLNPEKQQISHPLNIGAGINAISYSPDGLILASGSSDKTIKLWDAKTGELKQTLKGHESSVSALSYSPDGSVLASGSDDKTIKLWDTKTGELKQTLKGHEGGVLALVYRLDNQVLASGSDDNTIKLWDAKTGKLKQTLKGHDSWVTALSYSPNGSVLASGSQDTMIKLWDAKTGELRQALKGSAGDIHALSYSPDGRVLASSDNTIKLWDAKTGELKQTLKGHKSSVLALSYSPDGRVLASGSSALRSVQSTIKLWDAKTGGLKQTLKGHERSVLALSYSQDSRVLASGSDDKTIKLWDANTGERRQSLKEDEGAILVLSYSGDGSAPTLSSDNKTIKRWSTKTDELKQQMLKGHKWTVTALSYSPDGGVLASGSQDTMIKLWDMKTGKLKQTLKGHDGSVKALSYSPSGSVLTSGSSDKTIKLWDANTGELKQTLKGHEWVVNALSYSPDGRVIASGSQDKMIKLWDAKTGELKQTLNGHEDYVRALSYSRDGSVLASGSSDKMIKLWDANTGELKQTLKGHDGSIEVLSYDPDGRVLASGSGDKTIKLWDANTGELQQTLKGHENSVLALSYHPDGQVLASGSSYFRSFQGGIKLWNVSTGELKQTLRGRDESIYALSYSYDGSVLASGSDDNTIKLWDKYVLMTQDLFYKYDPAQVSATLKFLWEMGFDEDNLEFVYKVRTPALYPNKWGYYYSSDMDKFMPLLEMPKQGETKADQLIQWLQSQCAYKNPAEKENCLKNQAKLEGESHAN